MYTKYKNNHLMYNSGDGPRVVKFENENDESF